MKKTFMEHAWPNNNNNNIVTNVIQAYMLLILHMLTM